MGFRVSTCLALVASAFAGCGENVSSSGAIVNEDAGEGSTAGLPVVQAFDQASAARGAKLFTEGSLGKGFLPKDALRYLWLVWGTGAPASDEAFYAAFSARYGFIEAPFDNGGYPLGIREAGANNVSIECLACHGNRVAGTTVLGVGNSTLDLQGLYDDLSKLREVAKGYGVIVPDMPFVVEGRTGARGANDVFGLGMSLGAKSDPRKPKIHETAGFQQAPAWWSLRFRKKMYADGSGQAGGYRTMMATLLASGESLANLQASDAKFADLYQYLLSLDAPKWPFASVDAASRKRGQVMFDHACASCHGVHTGEKASFPDRVVPASEVGTDPVRAASFDANDASWVNSTWFGGSGATPFAMASTGGYLAPPLVGVWATAPYFHNGSVPTLAAVLDPALRPTRWEQSGSESADYDVQKVGWRVKEVAAPPTGDPISVRRVYDTTKPGLGNGGHEYGKDLSSEERSDLLLYLRGL